jgi:hypothetical protein
MVIEVDSFSDDSTICLLNEKDTKDYRIVASQVSPKPSGPQSGNMVIEVKDIEQNMHRSPAKAVEEPEPNLIHS